MAIHCRFSAIFSPSLPLRLLSHQSLRLPIDLHYPSILGRDSKLSRCLSPSLSIYMAATPSTHHSTPGSLSAIHSAIHLTIRSSRYCFHPAISSHLELLPGTPETRLIKSHTYTQRHEISRLPSSLSPLLFFLLVSSHSLPLTTSHTR